MLCLCADTVFLLFCCCLQNLHLSLCMFSSTLFYVHEMVYTTNFLPVIFAFSLLKICEFIC